MTFPFDITPDDLPPYYQQIYMELMEGIKSNEITIMPCKNKQDLIIWVVVRIKLEDEGEDEEGNSISSMSITPLSLIPPTSIALEVEPILPDTDEVNFIKETEIEDIDTEDMWRPPTQGVMRFPSE
jgi:hypothetical protein